MSKGGRNEQSGDKNWKYDGGWYSLGKSQKQKARDRDGYICQRCKCAVSGKNAHVHHVVPERCFDDPRLAHDLENLITLCGGCHLKFEWETIHEMYERVLMLDTLMKNEPNFQTFEDFKKSMVGRLMD
jgi:5-methylcytosine-specific restriction endonuclease McrA